MSGAKGKSGRPPSQSPKSSNLHTISGRIAALKYAEKAMRVLADMLTSPKHEVRVSAANSILDRAYGKPKQEIDANVSVEHTVTNDAERFTGAIAGLIARGDQGRSPSQTEH